MNGGAIYFTLKTYLKWNSMGIQLFEIMFDANSSLDPWILLTPGMNNITLHAITNFYAKPEKYFKTKT